MNSSVGEVTTEEPKRAVRFAVVCARHDGREREWQRYAGRGEAERVARRLREIGCPARVVESPVVPPEAAP